MTEEQNSKILNYFKINSVGEAFNIIQDIGIDVMTKKETNKFFELTNKDADMCEGQDGMLVNGIYYDWKEFETKHDQMIQIFLSYFESVSLKCSEKVNNALVEYIEKAH